MHSPAVGCALPTPLRRECIRHGCHGQAQGQQSEQEAGAGMHGQSMGRESGKRREGGGGSPRSGAVQRKREMASQYCWGRII